MERRHLENEVKYSIEMYLLELDFAYVNRIWTGPE
jgi:hypothetical protein